MPTSLVHFFDCDRFLSASGGADGGTVFFYYTGTTNLAPIYSDADLTSPMPNPVVIAVGQILPRIYLSPSITYRRRIVHTSDGSVFDVDPIVAKVADASTVSFVQSGATSVPRSVESKNRDYLSPDDFGGKTDSAIRNALAESLVRGMPLVLTSGIYTLSSTLVLPTNTSLIIMGTATLSPIASGFAGTDLIQIGTTSTIASNVSISGEGTIDCKGLVQRAVSVIWGNFGEISVRNILGASVNAIKIGDAGAGGSSYEMNSNGLHIFNKDVVNDAASIGVFYDRATDCFLSETTIVGYRKGVRVDSDGYSIDMNMVHPWGRPAHGAMTHAFDIQGGSCTLRACYADTPYDLIGIGGDLYGFLFYGFGNMLTDSRVFMNTSYPGTDISTDGRLVCVQMDREVYMQVTNFYAGGGNETTRRFKQLFGGSLTTSYILNFTDGGPSFFTDSSTRIANIPATFSLGTRWRGRAQIDGPLVLGDSLDANGASSFIQTSGDIARYGAAGTNRDIFLRTGSSPRWGIRATNGAETGIDAGSDLFVNSYTDAGAFKATLISLIRSTGQVILGLAGGSGTRIRLNTTTGTLSPLAGGAGALPATPAGYVSININGTNRQLPYY